MDFENVLLKIKKAEQRVYDLCEGGAKWTMRVPVDENRDSDCIIMDALNSAEDALMQASRENQQEYQKHEFCQDIGCAYAPPSGCKMDAPGCVRTAKEFHNWLKENGYRIVRITSGSG
jgi:hypothetical protein